MIRRPTTEECVTLRARYAEVDAALHQLRLGGAVRRIAFEGKETEFSPAKMPDLLQYLNHLAAQIALCDGCSSGVRRMIQVVPHE